VPTAAMALAALLALLGSPTRPDDDSGYRIFVGEREALTTQVRELLELSASGRWREALERQTQIRALLGEASGDGSAGGQVYPVAADRYLGVEALLREVFSRMPPEALSEYRAAHDGRARDLLGRARSARDALALERVVREFPYATSTPAAMDLLAALAMESGDVGRAAGWLEEMARDRPAGEERPGVLLRLAACYVLMGEEASAERVRGELATLTGGRVRVAGRDLSPDEALAPLARPRASRAEAPTGFAPGARVWTTELDGALDEARRSEFQERHLAVPLPRAPVADRERAYAQDGRVLVAVDLATGGVRWRVAAGRGAGAGPTGTDPLADDLRRPAVQEGRVYAALDAGEAVRRTAPPAPAGPAEDPGPPGPPDLDDGYARYERPPNHDVVAVDAARGRPLWSALADPAWDDAARHSEHLSSPALGAGRVFVGTTRERTRGELEAHLYALDDRTGRVLWHTFLMSGFPANPLGLGAGGSPPAFAGDTVYHLTNLGVLAAVDAYTGRIRWLAAYDAAGAATRDATIRGGRRWASIPPAVVGPVVVAAPRDAAYLYGLDRQDGGLRWRLPRDGLRLAGPLTEDSVWVGGDHVLALDARTGTVRWETPLSSPQRGLAASDGQGLWVPTVRGVARLDARTGEALSFHDWPDAAGGRDGANLELTTHPTVRLLAATATRLDAFEGEVETRTRLAREVALGDPEALLRRAELDQRAGDLEAPRADLSEARRRAASGGDEGLASRVANQAHRLHLERARRALASRDEAGAADEMGQALAERAPGEDRLDVLMRRGESLSSLAEAPGAGPGSRALAERALATWQEVLGGPEGVPGTGAGAYRDLPWRGGPGGSDPPARAGLLARAAVDRILLAHGREVYAPWEAESEALVATARKTFTKEGLEESYLRYPSSQAARVALLDLATFYDRKGARDQAMVALGEFAASYPDDPRTPEQRLRLGSLAESAGHLALALETYRALARDLGETPGERTLLGRCRERLASDRFRDEDPRSALAPSPGGFQEVWRTRIDLEAEDPRVMVPTGPGEADPAMEGVFLLVSEHAVEARSVGTGLPRWRRNLVVEEDLLWEPSALRVGDRYVVWRPGDAWGLDARTGEVAWRNQVAAPGLPEEGPPHLAPTPRIAGAAAVEGTVFLVMGRRMVLALDSASGERRWVRPLPQDLYPQQDPMVWRDRLLVVGENPATVHHLSLATGEVLASTPLATPDPRVSARPLLGAAGRLYCVLGGGTVAALDLDPATGGRPAWPPRPLDFLVREAYLTPDGEGLVLVPFTRDEDPRAVRLDARTGELRWAFHAELGPVDSAYVAGSDLYLLTGNLGDFVVTAVDLTRGEARWRWKAPPGHGLRSLQVAGEYLVLPHSREAPGRVFILERASGTLVQQVEMPGRKVVDARCIDGVLVVATDRGVFGYGPRDGPRLDREVAAAVLGLRGGDDGALRGRLGGLYAALGDLASAREALLGVLSSERVALQDYDDAYRRLEAVKEAQGEATPPSLDCPRMERPPEIDGELNDPWIRYRSVSMDGPAHVSPIQTPAQDFNHWFGREDLSATLYTGWDPGYFYFALDVRDSVLKPYDGEATRWVGDCLLIALDTRNNGSWWFRADDTLLTLALMLPNNKKDEKERAEEERLRPKGHYFVKRKDDGSGAIYEAALPWSIFAENGAELEPLVGPPEGFRFGLDLALTDDDDGSGARKYLAWTPGLRLHRDKAKLWHGFIPEHFADVVLR
ncbi:MAG: PQQ-binding-like beta-propeller repeat protein, partial [Planctomycetes bacterium]|nr:PQQ-binding-like beta-propeller repeat protein [Planctomycetota bacterium]